MSTLAHIDLEELGAALRQRGVDGWLVYDFHDLNPIARRLLADRGMITRRVFLWLPAVGPPNLIVHRIDQPALSDFPGEVEVYTTWQDLHRILSATLRGRRVAMEMSPENAVPYLDLVPHGVVELLTRLGATLLPSAPLVTQFSARWSAAEFEEHRQTAETIAAIARTTLERTLDSVERATEWEIQQEVLMAFNAAGLETEDPPIVAFGPHSADPHYAPEEGRSRTLQQDEVVLLDLWARPSPVSVWADQTWMGFSGPTLPEEVARVWDAVVEARDAAVQRLAEAARSGQRMTGAALDQAAREVIVR
ncbi:MAG: M24 family metallopeptidase, partial [Acidobacteriota bacterium]|nr:M24 family metallopeptidase [Acidobacteriota bacterium]